MEELNSPSSPDDGKTLPKDSFQVSGCLILIILISLILMMALVLIWIWYHSPYRKGSGSL